jgi:hypothetical protein
MGKLTRSAALLLLAGLLQAPPAAAQGTSPFHWYIGGQGGVMNYATATEGRKFRPMFGVHLLVTGKRTGLLLSAEHSFGDERTSGYDGFIQDSVGNVTTVYTVPTTFDGVRKYSAVLIGYPIGGVILHPYIGVGVSLVYLQHSNPEYSTTSQLGSYAVGTLVAGMEFRVSRFSAFGQGQITSKPSIGSTSFSGGGKTTITEYGALLRGPTYNLTAGLRIDLGNASEENQANY